MYVWHQNNTLTLRSCLIISFHLYAIYIHGKSESKGTRKISLYNSGLIATSGIWETTIIDFHLSFCFLFYGNDLILSI